LEHSDFSPLDNIAYSDKIKMNIHISMQECAPFLSVFVNSPFNPCRSPENCEETGVDQSLQTDT